jgi:hypothetical protein
VGFDEQLVRLRTAKTVSRLTRRAETAKPRRSGREVPMRITLSV